jgi:hypothetical protein
MPLLSVIEIDALCYKRSDRKQMLSSDHQQKNGVLDQPVNVGELRQYFELVESRGRVNQSYPIGNRDTHPTQ